MSDYVHEFSSDELDRLNKLRRFIVDWCGENQWEVGVSEMLLGAGLLAYSYQAGALGQAYDWVAYKLDPGWLPEATGAMASVGGMALYFVKSIGVTALGGAFGVPALALAGGAAVLFGLASYGAAMLLQTFLHKAPDWGVVGLGTVGLALLYDGAKRVMKDPDVSPLLEPVRRCVFKVLDVAEEWIARTKPAVDEAIEQVVETLREAARDPSAAVHTAGVAGAGAAAGLAVAPAVATFLGSSTLGPLAVSLGLISAPVWPVVVGAGLGAAAGFVVRRFLKGRRSS